MIRLNILYTNRETRVVHLPDPKTEEGTPAEAVTTLFSKLTDLDSLWIVDALTDKPVFLRARDFTHVTVDFLPDTTADTVEDTTEIVAQNVEIVVTD